MRSSQKTKLPFWERTRSIFDLLLKCVREEQMSSVADERYRMYGDFYERLDALRLEMGGVYAGELLSRERPCRGGNYVHFDDDDDDGPKVIRLQI